MKTCEHCGIRNPSDRTKCDFCGASLNTCTPLQVGPNQTCDSPVNGIHAQMDHERSCIVYQQLIKCGHCGGLNPLSNTYCLFCMQPLLPDQAHYHTSSMGDLANTKTEPNAFLIAIMWSITSLALILGLTYSLSGNKPTPLEHFFLFLWDLPPCIIAIILVNSKNKTDRVNGWVRLIIEFIGLLIIIIALVMFLVALALAIALKTTHN